MFDVIITYALFASGIVANKYVLHTLSPIFFVGVRMLFAGLILFLYIWYQKKHVSFEQLYEDRYKILFIAACTTFIPSNLKSFALKYLPASKATLLGSIDPFVTAIFAYFLWQERLTLKKILGILVGISGVLLSILSSSPDEIGWEMFASISYPDIATIVAVIISRYGWITVQKLLRQNRYMPMQINSVVMILSGLLSFMTAFLFGETIYSGTGDCIPSFWFALFYTICVGNVIGYTVYAYCLKKHNTTFMSLAGFLVPIFVALMSNNLLNETLTLNFVLSAALVFCGLLIFYSDEIKAHAVR